MKPLLALFASALLTVGATACGGGSETSTSMPSTTTAPATTTITTAASAPSGTTATTATTSTTPAPHTPSTAGTGSSSERSSSASALAKRYPHGDDSIQTFGNEAGVAEKQAVTATVKRYYAAVAAGDGASACALLSPGLSKSIIQSLGHSAVLRGKGCAGILALLFKHGSAQSGASLADIEVTGVRIKGDRGFALLHSKTMPSGEISVDRENGAWKVGALIGGALP